MLLTRRLSPTRAQTEEDIAHESEHIQNNVSRSRACGNDADADALLRRLRDRIQIESVNPDLTEGKRDNGDASNRQ